MVFVSLTTYPSPKSTLKLNSHLGQNCDLGRVRPVSYPKISNDPTFLIFLTGIKNGGVRTRNMKNRIVDSWLILCNLPAKPTVNQRPRVGIGPEVG